MGSGRHSLTPELPARIPVAEETFTHMILQPIIDRTLAQLQPNGNTPQPIIDFLRPLFLKNDPANGAEQFNAMLESPQSEDHQEAVKSVLRDELTDRPESVNKLETLVGGA